MQSQHINSNTHIQFGGSTSNQNQIIQSNNLVGLALGPSEPSTSGFQIGGSSIQSSNVPYDDWLRQHDNRGVDEIFSEEEIRMRSHEILENEDMQHLLRLFSMNGGHTSYNATGDGVPYSSYLPSPSPNYSYDEDRGRSSGKAVVGWLKIKAAMRWGIFIRKKAAEKRAQLIELDD